MAGINANVSKYLSYYYQLPYSPEYAVLLKGNWGAGKTWFVKNGLKENDNKYLYVSLYGVTSFDEIANTFFEQLHPFLSSKGMQLTSKIFKGAIKAAIRVDLDGDGKPDASINSTIPEIKLPDYLTNTDNHILVFDDLERCSMDIADVMGYINHFVEHQGYKVIVLANEDEIFKVDKKYSTVKEKLFGKTFKIKADVKSALTLFINEIGTSDVKSFYRTNFDLIVNVFDSSSFHNLRHLKHSLWDFERFYTYLPSSSFNKQGLIEELFKLFLCFSFESKSGDLSILSLKSLTSSMYSGMFSKEKNKEKTIFQVISEKYPTINFGGTILDLDLWGEFIFNGSIDAELIEKSIYKSKYYQDENTASWVKLWRYFDMNDDDFEYLYNDVRSTLQKKEVTNVNVLKHITGTFLSLSKFNIITSSKEEIVSESMIYVDYLKDSGLLVKDNNYESEFIRNSGWGGLGFHENESDEFKAFTKYVNEKIEESTIQKMPEVASDLLDLMVSDNLLFVRRLILTNHADNVFYKTPILNHICVDDFVNKLLSLNATDFRMTGSMFKERYSVNSFNDILKLELPWLIDLSDALKIKRQEASTKLSGYRINIMIEDNLSESINLLKKCE
ncbi:MAG: KAP family NTPase [Gammaproteobacteria bacterium]|nr:KAP family NTPase [Gammaproteobacteria bacterium]